MILLHLGARNRYNIPGLPRVRDPAQLSALLSTPFHQESQGLGLYCSSDGKLTPFGRQNSSTVRLPPSTERKSTISPHSTPTTSVALQTSEAPDHVPLGWLHSGLGSFLHDSVSHCLPRVLQAVPVSHPDHPQTLQMQPENHSLEQFLQKIPDFTSQNSSTGQTPKRSWGAGGKTESVCPRPPKQGRTRNGIQVSSPPARDSLLREGTKFPLILCLDTIPNFSFLICVAILRGTNSKDGWGRKVF